MDARKMKVINGIVRRAYANEYQRVTRLGLSGSRRDYTLRSPVLMGCVFGVHTLEGSGFSALS